ncbi:MAG TPA: hypothetical protein VFD43_04100, partial [Planctomycetota bacterium]|nr:hypothetical protein [Planctomycetota bacterium]
GTGYVGRGTTPLLADFFAPPGESGGSHTDCILVWHQDLQAGTPQPGADQTFLAVFVGDNQGELVDASPNQFLAGQVPGDPALGDFDFAPPEGDLDAEPAHLDVLVPNLKSNSLSLLRGDGDGGILATTEFGNVDELDPDSLPSSGLWVGGPRSVLLGRLNNDDLLDAVAFNLWEDQLGLNVGQASVSLFAGLGDGQLAKSQYLPLAAPGDVALGQTDADHNADLVATQHTDGVQDRLAVYRGLGNGLVQTVPELYPVPAGLAFAGGLASADVDGDLDADVLAPTLDGQLLVFVNAPGLGFTAQAFDLDADWDRVRSIDIGDITGDHVDDVLIGALDGRLFLAAATGDGGFELAPVSPTAGALGGGGLRVANLNGDNRVDVASSTRVVEGEIDQAFVRTLLGAGAPGSFAVQTLPGLSSVSPLGALRPAVGDMNEDGATDLVLAHGDGGTVSIHLNQLSEFETYGAGLPGAGGVTPKLEGFGYSTPGGRVELHLSQAVGGALGLMQIGTGQADHPYVLVEKQLAAFLIMLGGAPGVPGAGSWIGAFKIPDQPAYVGLEL